MNLVVNVGDCWPLIASQLEVVLFCRGAKDDDLTSNKWIQYTSQSEDNGNMIKTLLIMIVKRQ